jgi:predicted dehydrogenase
MNRRSFLQQTTVAAVGAMAPGAFAQGRGVIGANDRIRMAIIGAGGRGNQVLTSFAQAPNNVFIAVAEVFQERLDSTVKRLSTDGQKVDGYEDYRRVLDRQDIDGVLIATPDHWHPKMTIDAVAAGKDVFLEKPTSNAATLAEAARAVDAVRASKRVVQVGTQQRSWPHFAEAKALLPQLGGVTHVVMQYGGPGNVATEPTIPVPAGFNWDLFQGPVERKPYKNGRHRQWRTFWDYGGGLVTDWGVHLVDTALWFMDAQRKAPAVSMGVGQYVNAENPDPERVFNAFTASWQYENFVMSFSNAAIGNPEFPFQGTVFIGPRGSLVVNRVGYMLRPSQAGGRGRAGGARGAANVPQPGGGAGPAGPAVPPAPPIDATIVRGGPELEMVATATTYHVVDFLNCMRSRNNPVSDFEIGFYATLPCALAINSMRQRRAFGWDAQKRVARAL